MNPSTIFLYGPPGSGKSTIGRILADNLHLPFYDLDVEIENRSGCTVAQIFLQQGESGFRDMERQEIERLLTLGKAVVALGGGSLTVPAVCALAEVNGTVLCLDAAPGVLLDRLQTDPVPGDRAVGRSLPAFARLNRQRPLLAGDAAAKLADLLAQRAEHYASFPVRLDTTQLDPAQAAWEVQIILGRFRVGMVSPSYEVCIQPGALDTIGQALSERDIHGPLALVTDSNTAPLYATRVAASLESAGLSLQLVVIPAGESNKTIASAQKLWENFLDAGLERGCTVIALGGGVVGDLTGFAASTYMRGIQWVNVPTTLLAMVDSSLGGKTGVDIPRGKNLIGAFHPPSFVLADPEVLATLPEAEFRSGLAEVIKHAIIGDPGLLNKVAVYKIGNWRYRTPLGDLGSVGAGERKEHASGPAPTAQISGLFPLSELVSRAMAVKIGVIETDPYEKGVRAALNLGHTVGHALELVSGYRLRHGEAVAIGMVVEARLAERLGLAEGGLSLHIATVLAEVGLPVAIPGDLDRAAIRRAIGVDKKKAQGRVRFALPTRIGQVQIGIDVPDDVLASEIGSIPVETAQGETP
jgi:3-dehydroquinate synthase